MTEVRDRCKQSFWMGKARVSESLRDSRQELLNPYGLLESLICVALLSPDHGESWNDQD